MSTKVSGAGPEDLPDGPGPKELPLAIVRALHHTMLRIRLFEETAAQLVEAGELKTPCHLYIGQEAIAAGVCSLLEPEDYVWGGHRSHGHYLAKGGDLKALMAELFAKGSGCSKGRGGSMHLVAPQVGILGTVPIVAATIPLAVGSALATKLRGERRVSVAFFGDGAMEEGHFHESMNLAALYRLPVVFVCENNLYASHMSLLERRVADNLVEAASMHGLVGESLDGNDVLEVRRAATDAVARAREGLGPTLLECRTYRWRGHVGASWDYDVGVKRRDELSDWLPKDPIKRASDLLKASGVDSSSLASDEAHLHAEMTAAVEFARASPSPQSDELLQHVFAE